MSSSPTPGPELTRRSHPAPDTETSRSPAASPGLVRGDQVGRYLVVGRIASGGMGVVYHGYDPELARKIALKLLRTDVYGGRDASTLRARMLREARAMASLSHPNVVPVYDVGTTGEQVFLAMEFVDGSSLQAWAEQRTRRWTEVLAVYVAAGRGLSAAHEAGLVHGDFKPHNVLVTPEASRVCVTDFGLARPMGADEDVEAIELDSQESVWFGTPGYLAPELHDGAPPDARSDQFAFCVSMYETLHGCRPFAGRSIDELAAAAGDGLIRAPPANTDVPGWVHRAIVRGLAPDPTRRHASMRALVGELERDRRASVRRGAAIAALGAIAVGSWAVLGTRADVCAGAAAQLDGIWDGERRAALADAFSASDVPFAAAAWAAVEPAIDRHRDEWIAAHTDACTATRVRGEQSEELLDRRMLCLERGRRDLRGLVDVLASADAVAIEHAVEAVYDLPPPDDCADPDALGVPPPPADARAEVDAIADLLARVDALRRAGHWNAALPLAQVTAARADALGYEPLRAEALLARGRIEHALALRDADATFHAALVAARAGRDARLEADLWVRSIRPQDVASEDAERTAEFAAAAVLAVGDPPLLRARLLNALGTARHEAGRTEAAVAVLEEAVELWSRAVGPGDPSLATPLVNLASAERSMYRHERAAEHLQLALDIVTRTLGPDHPKIAESLASLCLVEFGLRQYDQARAHCERASAVLVAAFGADHPSVARQQMNLGTMAYERGDLDAASRYYEPAMRVLTRTLGADDPQMAPGYSSLAKVRCARGDFEGGLDLHRRALALREASLPPGHAHVLGSLLHMGNCERDAGRTAAAIEHHERAIALAAVAPPSAAAYLAYNRFALAQLVVATDRRRALELARTARDGLLTIGDTDTLPEIARWLAEHER